MAAQPTGKCRAGPAVIQNAVALEFGATTEFFNRPEAVVGERVTPWQSLADQESPFDEGFQWLLKNLLI
jgi:hypothetical protein